MAENKLNIKNLLNWFKGNPLSAEHLDQPVRVLQAQGAASPPGQDIPSGSLFQVRLFKVIRLEEDVIICNFTDSKADGEDEVKVAMPYLLRYSAFNSTSFPVPALRDGRFEYTWTFSDGLGIRYDKRTSIDKDNGDDEEIQVIVGKYDVGDLIFAAKGIYGGTGVYHDPIEKEKPVVWQDMNYDGRFWAKSSETEEE